MSRPLITVKTLLAQSRRQGDVTLPDNALVTPAAADWLQAAGVTVRRVAAEKAEPTGVITYVVGDAGNPVLQTLLPSLERKYEPVEFLPCNGYLGGLLEATRRMCTGLTECSGRRGIALVRKSAIISCVANKCPGIRAAIVSQPTALFPLMRELGLNLLVVEPHTTSVRQIQGLIDNFLAGQTSVTPVIDTALQGVTTEGLDLDGNRRERECGSPK